MAPSQSQISLEFLVGPARKVKSALLGQPHQPMIVVLTLTVDAIMALRPYVLDLLRDAFLTMCTVVVRLLDSEKDLVLHHPSAAHHPVSL
jgi:hypothetical protein